MRTVAIHALLWSLVLACLLAGPVRVPAAEKPMPVILDTDIGTWIDDAFAFSLLVASEEYELLGVTTCTGGAQDRAWMVCRFLTSLDMKDVPVAYGRSPQPESKIDWQIQYRRHPAVVWNRTTKPAGEPAEELMHKLLADRKDGVTIVALGPLTNVARLLEKHPEDKERIERIVLMGGSLKVGYDGKPPAAAEWNIKSDVAAAQQVFASGIPLVVAPLDATAGVKLTDEQEQKLFAAATPLTLELENLVQLWRTEDKEDHTLTLHDAVAVRLGFDTKFCETKHVRVKVTDEGKTQVTDGEPNALVATSLDADKFAQRYVEAVASFGETALPKPPQNRSQLVARRGLPKVVHAFEDYDNDIEKRWWMTGKVETGDLPPGSRRVCRAVLTQDYDAKMGDTDSRYKAVIFNPVPGPPMGPNTRLAFRYKLSGTDTLRVQLFSLSNGYHRYLSLDGLPQDKWAEATVDMTKMRRPDGSGGPLAEDERIDDIQFYIDPRAELLIDSMILYEAAPEGETRPFPKRLLFTGWFDTGRQGREWPGDFEIVLHKKPRTWDAAKSVVHKQTGRPWIRLHLRGERRLAPLTRLRFSYKVNGADAVKVALVHAKSKQRFEQTLATPKQDAWSETTLSFDLADRLQDFSHADEIHFLLPEGAELLIDDLLLYEPGGR